MEGRIEALQGWLLLAAFLAPLLNWFMAFWAHARAYRLGWLHTGAILGAALGPLAVIGAGLLPLRRPASAAILSRLQELPDDSVPRWYLGLVLLLLGSGFLTWQIGSLMLRLPETLWTLPLAGLTILLLLGGSMLLWGALPPSRCLPPLGDYEEFRERDPDFAANLQEAHSAWLVWQRQQRQIELGTLLAVPGLLILLASPVLLTGEWKPEESLALRSAGWIALSFGLAALSLGIVMSNRGQAGRRVSGAEQGEAAIRNRANWHPVLTRDEIAELARLMWASQVSYRQSGRDSRVATYLLAFMIVFPIKALLGLAGLGPYPGLASLWFLTPLVLAWLPWQLARRSEERWTDYERDLYAVREICEMHNAKLPLDDQMTLPPLPPPPPPAIEPSYLTRRMAWLSFVLFWLGRSGTDASGLFWLLLAIVLWAAATRLQRRDQNWAAESAEREAAAIRLAQAGRGSNAAVLEDDGEGPRFAHRRRPAGTEAPGEESAAAPEASRKDAADPEAERAERQARRLRELDQEAHSRRMDEAGARLSQKLISNGFLCGLLAYCGLGLVVFSLAGHGLTEEGRIRLENFGSVILWGTVICVSGCLLLLLRGAIEDELAGLPMLHVDDRSYRGFLSALLYVYRIERGLRLYRRILWGGGWLLGFLALLVTLNPLWKAALQDEALAGLLGSLAAAALSAMALAALRILILRRELGRARSYARKVARERVEEQVEAWLATLGDDAGTVLEDHGHFSVEYANRPPPQWIAKQVEERVRVMTGDPPSQQLFDTARSVCYSLGFGIWALLLATGFGAYLPQVADNLLFALALLFPMAGIVFGAILRTRIAPWG